MKEIKILTEKNINDYIEGILKNELDYSAITVFGLAALAGLKKNEICGLRWEDIDWQRKVINIKNIRDTDGLRKTTPRTTAFPDPLADILRLEKKQQEFLYGRNVKQDNFVYMMGCNIEKETLPDPLTISRTVKHAAVKVNNKRKFDGKEELPSFVLNDLRCTFIELCRTNVDKVELSCSTGDGSSDALAEVAGRKSINNFIKSIITVEIK